MSKFFGHFIFITCVYPITLTKTHCKEDIALHRISNLRLGNNMYLLTGLIKKQLMNCTRQRKNKYKHVYVTIRKN